LDASLSANDVTSLLLLLFLLLLLLLLVLFLLLLLVTGGAVNAASATEGELGAVIIALGSSTYQLR